MNKAVFLDRDGVINELIYYRDMGMVDSPFTVKQFRLLPGAGKAINIINKLNFKAIIVSNQPGVARDHFNEETLALMDIKMKQQLAMSNAFLDGIYYCFHDSKGRNKKYRKVCNCRKPKPGLLIKASKDFGIDLSKSYIVGDELADIQAGKSVGCKVILLGRMKCQLCRLMDDKGVFPDFIAPDLLEAVKIIKKGENKK
jgi:D,D-heptose 1,7-bisphosphate phosphatase